jgi:protein-disulfide isomerase
MRYLLVSSLLIFSFGCQDNARVEQLERRIDALERRLSDKPRVTIKQSERTASVSEAVRDINFSLSGNERDDPFLGKADAPVTMMAFIDYTSRASQEFVRNVVQSLRNAEIKQGELRLTIRDFPSSQLGIAPATAAHCVGEQGKYWDFFDAWFEGSGEISSVLEKIEGLNPDKLAQCQDSSRYLLEIERDVKDGRLVGVKGVPASFVGRCLAGRCTGKFIRGAQPLGVFQSAIRDSIDSIPMR